MMRNLLIGAIVGLLLAAGSAVAATSEVTFWSNHAGVTCGFGTGPQGRGVACMQNSQQGYAVTLTHTKVVVWLHGKQVFARRQP